MELEGTLFANEFNEAVAVETLYKLNAKKRYSCMLTDSDIAKLRYIVGRWNEICMIAESPSYKEVHEEQPLAEIAGSILYPEFERRAISLIHTLRVHGVVTKNEVVQQYDIELNRLFANDKVNLEFTIYQTMQRAYKPRTVDLIRTVIGDEELLPQVYFENSQTPIESHSESEFVKAGNYVTSPEEAYSYKETYESIFGSETLTADEKTVIKAMIETDGKASYRELERLTGINRQRISRLVTKAKPKIRDILTE